MIRRFAAWLAALGVSMLMLSAHAYGGTIQKVVGTRFDDTHLQASSIKRIASSCTP